MAEARFRLTRSQSVLSYPDRGIIRVGTNPPRALEIRDPPTYLAELLEAWSEPRSITEMVEFIIAAHQTCDRREVQEVIDDLMSLGVLQLDAPIDRYDRHQLYFDFFGIGRGDYERILATKRVGLLGTGGIGSNAALLLAAAGVGTLVISDGDVVEETNLTRTILFDEADTGQLKVLATEAKLGARNRDVTIVPIPKEYDGPEFVGQHFTGCDVLLLSADTPQQVHKWTSDAATALSIPYLSGGYVETYGVVGPFVLPGRSPCFTCNALNGNGQAFSGRQLNHSLQAPSYGPLNALVASIAANEILRYLLGLEVQTLGKQMLVNSADYQVTFFPWVANEKCACGAYAHAGEARGAGDRFAELAALYKRFRESSSLNAFVLDDAVMNVIPGDRELRILDVGCGIGTLSIALARQGHKITAIDVSPNMLEEFRARLPPELASHVTILEGDAATISWGGQFDCILLNLVLDHIEDPAPLLVRCRDSLAPGGRLFSIIPHPFKDGGHWEKAHVDGQWEYQRFVLDDYFREGPISKTREDDQGNVVLRGITSFRRTLSSYFSLLTDAGFQVTRMVEPQPRPGHQTDSVNFAKVSRVPYFLIIECSRPESRRLDDPHQNGSLRNVNGRRYHE